MGLFSAIFAPGEQKRGEELDAKLGELNQQKRDNGTWTQAQFEEAEKNRVAGVIDVDSEIRSEFTEGLKEGASNIGSNLTNTLKNVFSIIPWQAWIIIALVAFVYFGGIKSAADAFRK